MASRSGSAWPTRATGLRGAVLPAASGRLTAGPKAATYRAGALAVIVVLFLVYSATFIWQSSFVIDGTRYFSLFDDPMISMRYARNLAEGHGPVWNAGEEPVEGYSNPLWTGVMALVHLMPIADSHTSLAVQILAALLLAANLVVVWKIADELAPQAVWVAPLAVLMTALYYPLNNWGLLGNDVAPAVFLIDVALWVALVHLRQRSFSPAPYIILGTATWLRLDLCLAYIVVLGFLLWRDREHRRAHLSWGLGWLIGPVAVQTAWRAATYSDLLPNPYYLKMVGGPIGLRIVRGLAVFTKFAWNFNGVVFLLPLVVLFANRDRRLWLPAAMVAAFYVYSIYVGGDAWEHRGGANRFLSTVISLHFILIALSLETIRSSLVAVYAGPGRAQGLSLAGMMAVTALAILNANAVIDASSLQTAFLVGEPLFVAGNRRNTAIGLFLRQITDEQARIAYVAAGSAPYFADRGAIDLLGKSDRHVARGPMRIPPGMPLLDYRPGHMKWDYAYSIGQLRPDIVVEVWQGKSEESEASMGGHYEQIRVPALDAYLPDGRMYIRMDSAHILWAKVEPYLPTPEDAG